ncbi:vWA domain-containing protein [Methylacidimicrobium tartarophylax]|uniref:VWFA domain-containing protein n=1 Tax=Methylacidimicrobium tartarophylax TaxID=1041768 RepID=A0A5E6MMC6_9BACT|nr:VWA domain-containing protein [Methylacidimicrobium tartarophylax]VVM06574.1 hypothetical protein MAMT_01286 [Methylacidimicrobium tartarophylax]
MIGSLFLKVENFWGLVPCAVLPLIVIWQRDRELSLAQERRTLDSGPGAHHWPKWGRRGESLLLCLALLASAGGMAGLRWGWGAPAAQWRHCEFWLLLDTSLSMRAQDTTRVGNSFVSRLEWAELVCSKLFESFPGARFGIIPFAGDASVLLLPSTDRNEFAYYLQSATAVPKSRGTDLVEPLRALASEWTQKPPASPMPVVVLLSDGGREEGREIPIAKIGETAKEVQAASPRVLFVCVAVGGDREAAVPSESPSGDVSLEEDFQSKGLLRTARFDPPLETVSEMIGGLFFRAKDISLEEICRAVAQRLEKQGMHPEWEAEAGGEEAGRVLATLGLGILFLLTTLWSRQ